MIDSRILRRSTTPAPPVSRWRLVLVLGALTSLGPFTMDLYLPAFPQVGVDLGASVSAVQLTLTATALGLGVGQLLIGMWSDHVGRRIPLLVATAIHIGASLGVALAPSIEVVMVMRFGQGFGAAAGAVVALAMVRDVFSGTRLVRTLANIALISGATPVVAPLIGSQLLRVTSWRGIFELLAGFGLCILIASVLLLRETLPLRDHSAAQAPSTFRSRLSVLVHDRVFVGAAVISGVVFAAIITYLSTSPFLFQNGYGLDPQQFGVLFAAVAVALLLATQGSALLMRRHSPARLLRIGLPVLGLSGVALVLAEVLDWGVTGAAVASMVLVASTGFCTPCMTVLALEHHPREAGTAGAIMGFGNSVVGGVISPLPGLLGPISGLSVGAVVLACAVVGCIAVVTLVASPRDRGAAAA